MKAILLAGGKGTRLRPLTIHTPKPIVPIFDRPFLHYQLDLLKQVAEIDEVILSLNYQPRRIEEMFGDGGDSGLGIKYVVEPAPLGTAGAIRYAGESLRESVVVFNGDVLTEIDLAAVIRLHRERNARATIVLTPVDNPSAYGLVETDADGNIQRFLEKPKPDEITCNTINAGIYILEPDTFDRIPKDTAWSIERSFFPSLIERGETFLAYIDRGYWIDIGTPEKYMQVHRDIMDGRFRAAFKPLTASVGRLPASAGASPAAAGSAAAKIAAAATSVAAYAPPSWPEGTPWISPEARVEDGVTVEGPCFIDAGAVIKTGARIGPYSVIGRHCWIEEHAVIDRAILWPNSRISQEAVVRGSILGRQCHVGRSALIDNGVVLGDKSAITDYSRL